MAAYSRATPGGQWAVGTDTAAHSRATPGGQWDVQEGVAAPAGTILPQMLQQGLYAGYGNAA